jgi:hypothetical protein
MLMKSIPESFSTLIISSVLISTISVSTVTSTIPVATETSSSRPETVLIPVIATPIGGKVALFILVVEIFASLFLVKEVALFHLNNAFIVFNE